MIIPSRRWLPVAVAVAAGLVGAVTALHYHAIGLTLSHYDARGHLIVARRIIDSITPGWQQVGAVWLPLPHLLNALQAQVDAWYRSGLSAVVISVFSFAVATGALAWIVRDLTTSTWAALVAAAVFATNPNILYLQATPMTEPLFLACTLVAIASLQAWCREPGPTLGVGLWWAAACLTRFEAWPVSAAAIGAATWTRWRAGRSIRDAVRDVAPIARYPVATVIGFAIFSRIVVGEWFVSSGFYVPDPTFAGPVGALTAIQTGIVELSPAWPLRLAIVGFIVLLVESVWHRQHGRGLVAAALGAAMAVPWVAFAQGHPYRVRYMVSLIAVEAIGAGLLAGLAGRLQHFGRALAVIIAAAIVIESRPLDEGAPVVVEARRDRPYAVGRQAVSACLTRDYDRSTIMASMGSLGHYMQELASHGFTLRDFLHEGNGDIWIAALERPRPYVGWILIEEEAEGGDMLAQRARASPRFLDGFTRVCAHGGVTLYRRALRAPNPDIPPALGARGAGSSELDGEGEQIGHSAEIDFGPEKISLRRNIPDRALIADFSADVDRTDRESRASHDQRTGRRAARLEVAAEDVVPVIDELTDLLIPELQHPDARADVRRERVATSNRQESNRGRKRYDPQLQVLLDFRSVGVLELGIHAGHGPGVVAHAETGIDKVGQGDEPLGTHRGAVEVADVEEERVDPLVQVPAQNIIVPVASCFAARDEAPDVERERLLGMAHGRQRHDGHQRQHPGEEERSTHEISLCWAPARLASPTRTSA